MPPIIAPTIATLIQQGPHTLVFMCQTKTCRHKASFALTDLPRDRTIPQLIALAKCTQCGGKNISHELQWPTPKMGL